MNDSTDVTSEAMKIAFDSIDRIMDIVEKYKNDDLEQYNKIVEILTEHKKNISSVMSNMMNLSKEFNSYKKKVDILMSDRVVFEIE